ncbi:MAG: hypothetical protein GY814_05200 [Gammaproteobacteria bacterium]|nr:hypothetical protein [Gammaproteobacteria bacterium]
MNINRKQKTLIIAGVLVFILAGSFPPWLYTLHVNRIDTEKPAGYAPIFDPPNPEKNDHYHGIKLDASRLVVQWLVIIAGTGLGLLLTCKKSETVFNNRDDQGEQFSKTKSKPLTNEDIVAAAKKIRAEFDQGKTQR